MKEKVLRLRKFPLEAEAQVRFGQFQIEQMSREELVSYAKQSFMLMTQLTHYAHQLLQGLEDVGVTVSPEDS